MQKRFFLLSLYFLFSSSVFGQINSQYPKYYFRNPLGIPMELTANLGELRFNHWHMGLDLRTQRKENLPVYAAAAGYITKIRIEPYSYGRSIFINHPNGMTTVYGHLNDFFPALEKYVTGQQYKNQSWEIELNFSPTQFPVFKSQLIAYSGNTGGSQGPHLHFEIRDTKTNKCLNPLLFGFPVKDDWAPEIVQLAVYDRNKSIYQQSPDRYPLKKFSKNTYSLDGIPAIQTGLKKVSFAIQTFDKMKRTGSEDGIYSAKIYFDNKPVTAFVLDSIDYDESTYINAQIDYKYHYNGGVYLQHLSLMPGEHNTIYKKFNGNGVFNLNNNDTGFHLVHIEVRDAYNNMSELDFMIRHKDSLEKPMPQDTLLKFSPNVTNNFQRPDFEMYLPQFSLYDTVPVIYSRKSFPSANSVSATHGLNDASIPIHGIASIRIKPDKEIPGELRNKIVVRRNDTRSSNVRKAEWQQGWLSAKFGDFGDFEAFIDTIPPEIKDIGTGDTVQFNGSKSIVVRASDNFGSLRNFRAEIDGQWTRFSNDKGGPFVYNFDERCPYGIHQLKVTVEDLVGNTATKTWWFSRNPYTPPPKKVINQKKKITSKKRITKK